MQAWTKWRNQTPLELLDPQLEGSFSQNEVIRCIHIGLLYAQEDPDERPTMEKVVSFLTNPLVDLPLLTDQSFFKHRNMEDIIMIRKGLDSTSDSNYESINGMTVSQFYPR